MVMAYACCDRVDGRDENGETPLHYACLRDDVHCAIYLLCRGADRTATDDYDRTALDYAHRNNKRAAASLLHSIADVSLAGYSDLHYACFTRDHAAVLRLLRTDGRNALPARPVHLRLARVVH